MFNPIDTRPTFPVPPSPRVPHYSSEQILDMDITELADMATGMSGEWRYTLTDGEAGWLRWAADRYDVAHVIMGEAEEDDPGTVTLTIDCNTADMIGEALADDGVDRAPCLSDDTALQRIVWCIGPIEAD